MSFLTKLLLQRPGPLPWRGLTIQQRLKSSSPEVKEQIMVTQLSEELDETEDEREARIEKLRHKSRLSDAHRNMVHGIVPYPEPKAFYHESVQYKRRTWARYGSEKSKVYPGKWWFGEFLCHKTAKGLLNMVNLQGSIWYVYYHLFTWIFSNQKRRLDIFY